MAKTYRDDEMLHETRPEYMRPNKAERSQRSQEKAKKGVPRNEIKYCTEMYTNEFIDHVLGLGFTEPEIQLHGRDLMAGFGSVISSTLRSGIHDTVIPRNARDVFNYAINRSGFPHCRIAAGQFEAFIKKVKEHRMTIPNIAQPGKPLPSRPPVVTRRVLAGVNDSQLVTLLDKHIIQETSSIQMRPPAQMSEITEAIAASETLAVRAAFDNQPKTPEEETTMNIPENNTPAQSTTDAVSDQTVTSTIGQSTAEAPATETTAAGDTPKIDLSGEKMVIEAMRAERETQAKIRKTQDIINEMNVNQAFERGLKKGVAKGMFYGAASVLTGFAIGVAISRFRK